ncbi:MAG TPA: alpha/beta fold hydrolase [Puia sp.]|nr:alpha/beta fold hydrolase [Puia sp.]
MTKRFFAIIAILASLVTDHALSQDLDKTLKVDGRLRQYQIHLPPGFSREKKYPVILAFHGGGGSYKKTAKFYDFNPLADQDIFIVVYPNAVNKAWSMPGISSRVKNLDSTVDDVHFISNLIDTLIFDYYADPLRIYCTGISRGGMFSFYLAYKLPDKIRAIAPVCGGISRTVAADYELKRHIPVLMINGTEDKFVSYEGGPGKLNKRNEENEDADMLPSEELLAKLVKMYNCNPRPLITNIPDIDPEDGCHAIDYFYSGGGTPVEFIKVVGGGHTWPGGSQYLPKFLIGRVCRDFNASEKIFEFFRNTQ